MLRFAEALVSTGHHMLVSASVDVFQMLPSHTDIQKSIKCMAARERKKLCDIVLQDMTLRGGGISCDGLNERETGVMYYDLVAHFIT